MGLLTILKKMKQKERELRLLMLYPPGRRSREGSGGPAGRAVPGAPYRARGARPARTNCPLCVTHVGPTNLSDGGGGGHTTGSGRGDSVPKAKGEGLLMRRLDQMSPCRGQGEGPEATRMPPPVGLA